MSLTIAVTGLNAGENPQPGPGIIRSLRRRFSDVTILGLVYDPLESGIYAEKCADFVYQLPYPKMGSEALLARIDYLLARHSIDVLIPTLDAEITGMLLIEQQLAARGVKTLLPRTESYELSRKTQLPRLAAECDCTTPVTLNAVETHGLAKAAARIGYPLMIKGAYYGAHKVYTEAALVDHFHEFIRMWGGPVIVQKCIRGSEFNVVAVGDGRGGVSGYCAVRKTIVSEKGKGFGGVTIRDAELDAIASRIIRHLKWRGPLELEFIKEERSGTYYLIELNPRFPAWVDFPSTIGHNLPALVIDILGDGPGPRLASYDVGKFFVRHSIDMTGDVEQLDQLSTLGELVCREPVSGRELAVTCTQESEN
jgi:carbamoyl-phosphate synthase large subunit